MFRPTRTLYVAAETFNFPPPQLNRVFDPTPVTPRPSLYDRPSAYTRRPSQRGELGSTGFESRFIILHDVPRTALPADILRSLRERDLVSKDFPLMNITPRPITTDRTPSLSKSYHITFPIPLHAINVIRSLQNSPLFPNHHTTRRSEYCQWNAEEFYNDRLKGFEKYIWTMNQRRQTGAAASHSQFDHEWMNRAKDFAGRRVVLKGLPKGIPDALVRDIVKTKMYGRIQNGVVDTRDTGILADADGVKRMPMSHNGQTSIFALTFNTVSQACRAARILNMSIYHPFTKTIGHLPPVTLRAEVAW